MEIKTEQIIFYVMKECGRRITADGLEHQRSKTSNRPDSRARVCREHNTLIDHRESDCTVCGELFSQSKSGQMSKFCPGCRVDQHKKIILQTNRHRYLQEAGFTVDQDVDCPLFQNICKVCIEPVFPCSVIKPNSKMAAA